MNYELVGGLEIHAQLATRTKAFCACPNRFGAPSNTLICPVCLGLPGALPVANREMGNLAGRLAAALQSKIMPQNRFDRKNYFYPDLPKGYQISQWQEPFALGGRLTVECCGEKTTIRIRRIHIEEDAGKLMHLPDGSTVIDLNRCGIPLVEIVTEPDLRSANAAGAFLRELRNLLRSLEVCDGNMEQGSLRCDVNVSVRPEHAEDFNERTEVKNLNSIRAVEQAVQTEFERQVQMYESGRHMHRETLLWNDSDSSLHVMRRKEGFDDYRYFPEPDLVELTVPEDQAKGFGRDLPELPSQKRERYRDHYHLGREAIQFFSKYPEFENLFKTMTAQTAEPVLSANFIQSVIAPYCLSRHLQADRLLKIISVAELCELLKRISDGTLSFGLAKEAFNERLTGGRPIFSIMQENTWSQITASSELLAVIDSVLEDHPDEIRRYKAGKKKLLSYLVGEAMIRTQNRADPVLLKDMMKEKLEQQTTDR